MAELSKKIDFALNLIQSGAVMAEKVGQPIEIAYSGGKDSDVILELAKMSGVNYRAIYKNTTIDPAGTIQHAIENGAEIIRPKLTFAQIIETNGLSTRRSRICCSFLKEYKVLDYAVIGIRREESTARAARYKEPEQCRVYDKKNKVRQYMPILEWTINDVEKFVKDRKIKLAPVYYDENGNIDFERRLGCMCCPLADKRKRIQEFRQYPNMVKLYARACGKYLETHPNGKAYQLFGGNEYNMLTKDIFCESYEEYKLKFGRNLFDDGTNCKDFLENFFGIEFKQ